MRTTQDEKRRGYATPSTICPIPPPSSQTSQPYPLPLPFCHVSPQQQFSQPAYGQGYGQRGAVQYTNPPRGQNMYGGMDFPGSQPGSLYHGTPFRLYNSDGDSLDGL